MRYQEDKERSSELLRMALPLMVRQSAAHHPVSYSLWYEHVAGLNPPLSEALNERLQANAPLTEDDTYQLHARFISARDVALLERLQREMHEALEDTAYNAARAGEETGVFGRTLERSRTQIAAAVSLEGLQYLISSLVTETARMQTLSLDLSGKLEARAKEVLQLSEQLQRAQTEAVIDPLCGLNNRRGFDRAAEELASPNGLLTETALLVADIDHFKQINDTYGHVIGDKVLKTIAQTFRDNVKGRDIAARIGGEEFAVLLPRTTLEGAKAVAELLRVAVSRARIRQGETQNPTGTITLSAGVAVTRGEESCESLMRRADRALYTAKREGRNRVCVAM
jgi:diguanylate cyclase